MRSEGNPRRACAARVTVVGSVCLCVCVSVCLLSHISPMERLFVLKTLSRNRKICGVFSETAPLQRSITPSVVRPCVQSAIFPAESTHAHYSIYRVRFLDISIARALSTTLVALYLTRPGLAIEIQRRGFSTLVLFIWSSSVQPIDGGLQSFFFWVCNPSLYTDFFYSHCPTGIIKK